MGNSIPKLRREQLEQNNNRASSQEANDSKSRKASNETKQNKPSGSTSISSETKQDVKLPHNFKDIMKAESSEVGFSRDKFLAGVFLNQKKMRYWIDQSDRNCFTLYAKYLDITWSDDERYWQWTRSPEHSDEVEAAELKSVCWLEVSGKINAAYVTPETTYEAVFVVLFQEDAHGWQVPVSLRLVLPDGKKEHSQKLDSKPKNKWIEIPVGEFKIRSGSKGDITLSMFEHESGHWKTGLIVKGAMIRPKTGT